MTEEIIRTAYGEMPVYVSAPRSAGPWPGVVVVHDFAGMSQDLRNQADWLAGEGYLTAAPDLYYWGSRLRCLWTIMRELAAGGGRTFDDIASTRDRLTDDSECTGKIGVIGFCMGGAYAVALAPGHGYSASSVNYGGCPKNAEQALAGACPIVGSFGGRDRSPMGRSAAPRLDEALTALGVDHDVKVYPNAGHGFINDPDPADATPLLIFLAKISGTRYQDASAQDARRRIVAFFNEHLKAEPTH
jgi:carboxymethylenebutenolidase